MTKVLIYSIRRDIIKYRKFKTKPEAQHYARILKEALLNHDEPATVFIDVVPA